MKKCLYILGMMVSTMVYADDIEINGQFVIAPITSEDCNASAITEPSSELAVESDLFNMLTYFGESNNQETGIKEVSMSKDATDDSMVIYSVNGQKQNELKHGINIVVGSQGQTRKILVK